ncbi:hypothetical protein HELRODRAFT_151764, partial [Helobdella robusta]|uniref:Tctex1 domain-containing protein 1 n=1 Tax=Helobdella robusta TaxID=6412 RepID=T1EKM0_HELRO
STYRVEPVKKFTSMPVEKIIKRVMNAALKNETYNELKCIKLCHSISTEIRNRQVKQFNFSRYKYICLVTISEKRFSEVRFSSRCLWDPKVDNYAYYRFENRDLVAFGAVYACYYE